MMARRCIKAHRLLILLFAVQTLSPRPSPPLLCPRSAGCTYRLFYVVPPPPAVPIVPVHSTRLQVDCQCACVFHRDVVRFLGLMCGWLSSRRGTGMGRMVSGKYDIFSVNDSVLIKFACCHLMAVTCEISEQVTVMPLDRSQPDVCRPRRCQVSPI